MAQNELDLVDLGALIILPISSGIVFGVWELGIGVFGGYDFSQAIYAVTMNPSRGEPRYGWKTR